MADEHRTIPLTQGQVAVVDAEDYEWLMQWKWFAMWKPEAKSFYAGRQQRRENGKQKTIYMHREICLKGKEVPEGIEIDHINHNTLDFRRPNLRLASRWQNCCNTRTGRQNKTSKFKGVHWDKDAGRWRASIRVHGKLKSLGRFSCEEAAFEVYKKAALECFGDFTCFGVGR